MEGRSEEKGLDTREEKLENRERTSEETQE